MSTVTYKNQPAIHRTRGSIPLGGTVHPYKVYRVLWNDQLTEYIYGLLIGYTLHACCGMSTLGDVHLDLFADGVDVIADAARLPFPDCSFDTVLIDPPYNGSFQWNHDMLSEIGRVAKKRIIFQHWFLPVDMYGRFKKWHRFVLNLDATAIWQGQAYFGRAQIISVMDDREKS